MMEIKRIVSFLPSATELLYELGAQDKLYGVTHECLYPDDVRSKPRVINSVFDPDTMTSKEIDQMTTHLLKDGKDIFVLDEKNLRIAQPDLIISQNTCEVCAAHSNHISNALQILEEKPMLHSMDPHNLAEILQSVSELAKIINKEVEAKSLLESLNRRLNYIKNKTMKNIPNILAIEWIDPFFTSGHWVPEMIEYAGGKNLVSKSGERSRRMSFDEVKNSEPEIIVIMSCGFDTNRIISEYQKSLKNNDEWNSLEAVKANRVYAVDANSYFSKPSIRTITGVEILAKIFHPEEFDGIQVPMGSFERI